MSNKSIDRSLVVAALLLVVVVVYGVNQFNVDDQPDFVEITDYQGVRLSSITDFRENSIKGPQKVNITEYRLKISGLVENPAEYTYNETLEFDSEERLVKLDCVEGWSARVLWEGVRLTDLFAEVNPDPDSVTVIFHAVDGYTTSLPLSYVVKNDLILAYKINTVTLPEANGYPFMLVAESKWGYKWCRWVNEIELSDDPDYRGFWESRGYSNSADLDDSFREN